MEARNPEKPGNGYSCEDRVCFQLPERIQNEHFKLGAIDEFVAERTSKTESDANISTASSDVSAQQELKRFSFFSSKRGSAIHASEIGKLAPSGESFQSLFETGPTRDTWWLNILSPTKEEVDALAKAFSVHPLTSEDINTREIHEKVDTFQHYYFVCFRSFTKVLKAGNYQLEPSNVYLLVFLDGIISIAFNTNSHAIKVQTRVDMLKNYMNLSSHWICYALIDDIVDSFSPLISEIEQETSAIEDSVFITRTHDLGSVLSTVHACRKGTMSTIHLLRGKGVVIKNLARNCDEISLFLGDIQDHLLTMMSKLSHCDEILSRSHSDYLARLSMDRYRIDNHSLKVTLKITVIAAVIVPLMVICGLFGMNVQVPGKYSGNLRWWFGILGVIFLIVLTSLTVAKRMKLI